MSEMLRISDNVYLKISCIEAVEQEQDGVYVYTSTSKFKTSLPASHIISIIDLREISQNSKNEVKENIGDIDLSNQFVSL